MIYAFAGVRCHERGKIRLFNAIFSFPEQISALNVQIRKCSLTPDCRRRLAFSNDGSEKKMAAPAEPPNFTRLETYVGMGFGIAAEKTREHYFAFFCELNEARHRAVTVLVEALAAKAQEADEDILRALLPVRVKRLPLACCLFRKG